eukprot:15255830-Ditylum_brightwellii.AAC.1
MLKDIAMAHSEKNTVNCLNIPSSYTLAPLWSRSQTSFNETTRELFVLDEKKEHYANALGKSTNGLKYTQHVCGNKKGCFN